jgi:hypothetical protein
MGINEIDHTIYPNTLGREDCNVLPRSFKTLAEAETAGVGVRCWGALGGHRWCLLCRHSNGVLDVKRLREMRDVYLRRRLDGNEQSEDQRALANISEALMLLKAL